ncbi:MAG: adenosine deaminase [Vulcanimicrobiaceae bacterium]
MSAEHSDFLRTLPKVQLHCHLEGTVRPATLRELGRLVGLDVPADLYEFADFPEFLLAFQAVCKALNGPQAFARIAREYVLDAVAQGVRYAEIFISPSVWSFFHPTIDEEACMRAIREALDHDAIEVALICDLTRNFGPEKAVQSVERAARWKEYGVIGVGLGGDEARFPASLFPEAFELARSAGLHTVAHAGEVAGAQSVRDAVEILGAERIGHGIRALEDDSVVAMLVERRIPLEVCPTSNRRTGACPEDQVHPLAQLDAAGVIVTIDSDDPAMFRCTLLDEYALVEQTMGVDAAVRIARNGIEASFASPERKAKLLHALESAAVPARRS